MLRDVAGSSSTSSTRIPKLHVGCLLTTLTLKS
jgi:hypothetical protein